MKVERSFSAFARQYVRQLFTAIFNIFVFLPYYFSVLYVFKTFFYPWKRLVTKKTIPGFSFEEWIGRVAFNFISSGVGVVMRTAVLVEYCIVQSFFVLAVPFISVFYLVLLPFWYILSFFHKTEEEKKEAKRQDFFLKRMRKPENKDNIEEWFTIYYTTTVKKKPWWNSRRLFSTPPLAKDWSVGYTPTLDLYGEELTQAQSHFKHLVGRGKEISHIELALSKTDEANVLIVGEEGVGKHTIVEALAKKIYEGRVNPILAYKRIIKIDIKKILAQNTDIHKKEETLTTVFKEAEDAGNIIIFIDNLDAFVAQEEGKIDITDIIARFAASPKLQFIGITTPFLFQKYIFPNPKMVRLFSKIDVYEIAQKEAYRILMEKVFDFEHTYHVLVPYETIDEIIKKSNFYITYIPFPEKAIELLDEACAYAVQGQKSKVKSRKSKVVVTPDIVDVVLTKKTHIPVWLDEKIKKTLLSLEIALEERVIFQKEPIAKLSATIRNSFVISSKRKKPLASFLFFGPTGVGKTETAKALATIFFGSEDQMTRFDMSFYQNKGDIAQLIGSAEKGFPGLLTAAIREKPYGVLLLDELEKADPQLINIFLTVLDEGYFVDGYGKRVDCKNLVIIATSNAGSDLIFAQMGYQEKTNEDSLSSREYEKKLVDYLVAKHYFTPEFLNRFDGVVVYRPLSKEAIYTIAQKKVEEMKKEVEKLHHIQVNVSGDFLRKIVSVGYDPQFGARNMERVMRDMIEDKVAQQILKGKMKEGDVISF